MPESRSIDGYLDHLLGGGRLEGLLGAAGTPAWVRVEGQRAEEMYVSYGSIVSIALFRDPPGPAAAEAEQSEEPELVLERDRPTALGLDLPGEAPLP